MSRYFSKRIVALITGLLLMSATGFSQLVDVDFLRSAPEDGVKFIEAYISPWANAFGAGMNGSWYNTAKPHKFSDLIYIGAERGNGADIRKII